MKQKTAAKCHSTGSAAAAGIMYTETAAVPLGVGWRMGSVVVHDLPPASRSHPDLDGSRLTPRP